MNHRIGRAIPQMRPARKATTSIIAPLLVGVMLAPALARDNGQWAQSDPATKQWFNGLKSQQGLCCSFADGFRIDDVDWEQTDNPEMPYRVKIEGEWINVPKFAVIEDNNRVGYAIVWPTKGADGKIGIRCFIAGAQT